MGRAKPRGPGAVCSVTQVHNLEREIYVYGLEMSHNPARSAGPWRASVQLIQALEEFVGEGSRFWRNGRSFMQQSFSANCLDVRSVCSNLPARYPKSGIMAKLEPGNLEVKLRSSSNNDCLWIYLGHRIKHYEVRLLSGTIIEILPYSRRPERGPECTSTSSPRVPPSRSTEPTHRR